MCLPQCLEDSHTPHTPYTPSSSHSPLLTYSSTLGWGSGSGLAIPGGSTLCKRMDLRRTVSSSAFFGFSLEQFELSPVSHSSIIQVPCPAAAGHRAGAARTPWPRLLPTLLRRAVTILSLSDSNKQEQLSVVPILVLRFHFACKTPCHCHFPSSSCIIHPSTHCSSRLFSLPFISNLTLCLDLLVLLPCLALFCTAKRLFSDAVWSPYPLTLLSPSISFRTFSQHLFSSFNIPFFSHCAEVLSEKKLNVFRIPSQKHPKGTNGVTDRKGIVTVLPRDGRERHYPEQLLASSHSSGSAF